MGISISTRVGIDPQDFSRFDPVPAEGIARAAAIMQSGEIFRYSNKTAEESEVALLERDFAAAVGARYALGVNSCSKAIELALIACDVGPGCKVLVPGFTFTAVPSAIAILHATPVFVECTKDYRIDLEDLKRKITADTRVLLLSHMRGHAPDMDRVMAICDASGVTVIEDAAHALGGCWRGKKLGSFGKAGCYSFQSNKIINAGEGGVLVTDDETMMVKAVYLSGAYENNYAKHFIQSPLFEKLAGQLPAHNARMTNVTAAMARPQLALVEEKGRRYREIYAVLKRDLEATGTIEFPADNALETRIPDSIQFRIPDFTVVQLNAFMARVREKGIPLAGFADRNNARAFYNWHYLGRDLPELPQTRRVIASAFDLRLPSTLTEAHLAYLVAVLRAALHEVQMLDLDGREDRMKRAQAGR